MLKSHDLIKLESVRLERLLEQILKLAKLENLDEKPEFRTINLTEILEIIASDADFEAKSKNRSAVWRSRSANWWTTRLSMWKMFSGAFGKIKTVRIRASLSNPDALKNVTIDTPSGAQIPISAVATIENLPGPNQILRENSKRRIVIGSNVAGRDLDSVAQGIQQKITAQVQFPEGYFVEYGGQFEAAREPTRTLSLLTVFSLIAIFFLLIKALGDWRSALQVMINIPLALIGAVIALLLMGGVFSIATLVGFISLVGITLRNGIMMISHYLHLMREECEDFTEEMIIRGSLERLVPVMMTALTAGLSLLPLAVAAGAPGKEILHPLAVVVLGGIITSTLLDQLVTPAVFYNFGRPSAERIIAERERREKNGSEWGDVETQR